MRKTFKKIVLILLCLALLVGVYALVVDLVIKNSFDDRVLSVEDAAKLNDIDCIVVLGCKVRADGSPSDMLADRVSVGVDLFKNGVSDVLFMSGDHQNDNYNEVGTMSRLAKARGVPVANIEIDGMGLSTYESMWRLKKVYGYDRVVIVTQEFHLNRALYIADSFGIDAYGVTSDLHYYGNMFKNDIREIIARNKDFLYCIAKPLPTSQERADK